ncbi:hypothetical protein VTO73DRAFT_1704 [Trametes versicolor]
MRLPSANTSTARGRGTLALGGVHPRVARPWIGVHTISNLPAEDAQHRAGPITRRTAPSSPRRPDPERRRPAAEPRSAPPAAAHPPSELPPVHAPSQIAGALSRCPAPHPK